MAAPETPATPETTVTPVTLTLTFNAIVDSGASGKRTVTAEIHSDTFDPDLDNNSASAEVELRGDKVRGPYFLGVVRSIAENAVPGTHVGDPVAAVSPDGRTLTYSLSGPCSNKFEVHSNGQIVLAANHTLDYEEQWEYRLVLSVSDGVDAMGNADTSADDSIPVTITVIDTLENAGHPTIKFSTNPANGLEEQGMPIRITAEVENLTIEDGDPVYCMWTDVTSGDVVEAHACHINATSDVPNRKNLQSGYPLALRRYIRQHHRRLARRRITGTTQPLSFSPDQVPDR